MHDTNNIGIVVDRVRGDGAGSDGRSARDGIMRGNTVWNVDSYGNPAYGTTGARTASTSTAAETC